MPTGTIGGNACFKIDLIRVWVDIGKNGAAKSRRLEHVQSRFGYWQAGKPSVSDQQWPGNANRMAGLGKFGDAAGTKPDRCWIGKIGVGDGLF
jgi:hypothetical protein